MKRKMNNKGFTLVELIVVMAIMAILVGALAPQVIKYVEKARESKDLQVESTIFTAVQTAIVSSKEEVSAFSGDLADIDALTDATIVAVYAEILDLLADDMDDDTEIGTKCKSNKSELNSGAIVITYTAAGAISVKIGGLDAVTN